MILLRLMNLYIIFRFYDSHIYIPRPSLSSEIQPHISNYLFGTLTWVFQGFFNLRMTKIKHWIPGLHLFPTSSFSLSEYGTSEQLWQPETHKSPCFFPLPSYSTSKSCLLNPQNASGNAFIFYMSSASISNQTFIWLVSPISLKKYQFTRWHGFCCCQYIVENLISINYQMSTIL